MPARNRSPSVADIPIAAVLAMISNPQEYGRLIEEFSRAETAAKTAQSAAKDRENLVGHAEIAVKEREQIVGEFEQQQAQEKARLDAEGERLANGIRDLGLERAAYEAERRALEAEKAAVTEKHEDLRAAASAFMAAGT